MPDRPKAAYLRKHIGHEVKYFAFAVAEFRRPDAGRWAVPLQDSALVRGRSLLDFLLHRGKDNRVSIFDFLADDNEEELQKCQLAERWFGFISGRQSHVGKNRESNDDFDQWPDRAAGEEKGDDRLDRLAGLIVKLIRNRAEFVRTDCQSVLNLVAERAEEYLTAPSEAGYHAMDPANLNEG
jgi:hypothetical protein